MFRKFGPVYLPGNAFGIVLTLWTAFIAERTFAMVDRQSHSVSDTLLGAVPIIGTMLLLLWLLAARSAKA